MEMDILTHMKDIGYKKHEVVQGNKYKITT
jgi:hypothetical protein